jgi:hypothetical protein
MCTKTLMIRGLQETEGKTREVHERMKSRKKLEDRDLTDLLTAVHKY